jgi:heptosyltransferase II
MKTLLVQTGFLGDTVLSASVIGALHGRAPQEELWLLTTPSAAPLYQHDPRLAGVLTFDKRGRHAGAPGLLSLARELRSRAFDRVFSLHKSYRTSLLLAASRIRERIGFRESGLSWLYTQRVDRPRGAHEVQRQCSLIGVPVTLPQSLDLIEPPREALSDRARAITNGERQYVVLVPGSVWPTKRWAWAEYRLTARALTRAGYGIVVAGSESERPLAADVSEGIEGAENVAGQLSLPDLLSVVKNAAAVVCNDSMALHVASAFRRPTVAVFCATSPAFGFGPWQSPAVVVEKSDLFCKPCAAHGTKRCPEGTNACMVGVSSREVLDALRSLGIGLE